MIQYGAALRLTDRRRAQWRRTATTGCTLRHVVATVVAVAVLVVGLAGCAGGGDAPADGGSTFTPAGTATGDLGGSVEVNVEVGECVTLGGSADFASATPAACGSREATHKVVGKAPKAEECIADVDAAYYETVLGVAEAGALCLDIDWVQGHCFDLSGDDPKRVDCGTSGPDVVRAGERIEGTSEETACGESGAIAYPVRKFVVCLDAPATG